jgi:hypothetical protein
MDSSQTYACRSQAGEAYAAAAAARELGDLEEEEPPGDLSWLGQLGATLVAWLGRCVMDLMDDLVRTVVNSADQHRLICNLPRTSARVFKAHSAFVEAKVLACRDKAALYVDKAVDQAVHTHVSLKKSQTWASDDDEN